MEHFNSFDEMLTDDAYSPDMIASRQIGETLTDDSLFMNLSTFIHKQRFEQQDHYETAQNAFLLAKYLADAKLSNTDEIDNKVMIKLCSRFDSDDIDSRYSLDFSHYFKHEKYPLLNAEHTNFMAAAFARIFVNLNVIRYFERPQDQEKELVEDALRSIYASFESLAKGFCFFQADTLLECLGTSLIDESDNLDLSEIYEQLRQDLSVVNAEWEKINHYHKIATEIIYNRQPLYKQIIATTNNMKGLKVLQDKLIPDVSSLVGRFLW